MLVHWLKYVIYYYQISHVYIPLPFTILIFALVRGSINGLIMAQKVLKIQGGLEW